jgi:hypothetical protein
MLQAGRFYNMWLIMLSYSDIPVLAFGTISWYLCSVCCTDHFYLWLIKETLVRRGNINPNCLVPSIILHGYILKKIHNWTPPAMWHMSCPSVYEHPDLVTSQLKVVQALGVIEECQRAYSDMAAGPHDGPHPLWRQGSY